MLLIILQSLALGVAAGVIGAVYRNVLAYEKILNWWFRFGARYEKKWFWGPVWGCAKCVSGQIALWTYTGLMILPRWAAYGWRYWPLSGWSMAKAAAVLMVAFGLIFAICTAIFTALYVGKRIQSIEA